MAKRWAAHTQDIKSLPDHVEGEEEKKAEDPPQMQLQHQQYMPVSARRGLTDTEHRDIDRGLKQWLPTIFQHYGTPLHMMLASPWKQGLLAGLAGAGVGGLAGATIGSEMKTPAATGMGALLGALGVGGTAGLVTGLSRNAKNEGIVEMMRRLPESAVKRDLLTDPVYQQDAQREREANNFPSMISPMMSKQLSGFPSLSFDKYSNEKVAMFGFAPSQAMAVRSLSSLSRTSNPLAHMTPNARPAATAAGMEQLAAEQAAQSGTGMGTATPSLPQQIMAPKIARFEGTVPTGPVAVKEAPWSVFGSEAWPKQYRTAEQKEAIDKIMAALPSLAPISQGFIVCSLKQGWDAAYTRNMIEKTAIFDSDIKEILQSDFEKVAGLFDGIGRAIAPAARGLMNRATPLLQGAGQRIGSAFSGMGQRMGPAMTGMRQSVGSAVSGMGQRVGNMFGRGGAPAMPAAGAAGWDAIPSAAGWSQASPGMFSSAMNYFRGPGAIPAATRGLGSTLGGAFGGAGLGAAIGNATGEDLALPGGAIGAGLGALSRVPGLGRIAGPLHRLVANPVTYGTATAATGALGGAMAGKHMALDKVMTAMNSMGIPPETAQQVMANPENAKALLAPHIQKQMWGDFDLGNLPWLKDQGFWQGMNPMQRWATLLGGLGAVGGFGSGNHGLGMLGLMAGASPMLYNMFQQNGGMQGMQNMFGGAGGPAGGAPPAGAPPAGAPPAAGGGPPPGMGGLFGGGGFPLIPAAPMGIPMPPPGMLLGMPVPPGGLPGAPMASSPTLPSF